MGKIIDKNNNVISKDNKFELYTVIDFLERNGFHCTEYERISDLVMTMTGDASTPFNTIGEMIEFIPEIVSCGEECSVLCVYGDDAKWFILGWTDGDDMELNNKILHTYFPNYDVVID